MSETTKRLDLQFGSFACSVQGFDDPVQPVQQVLQALQNMLEETPEIGSSGFIFDAETIEQLIGEVARRADLDENNIEIVPGLIIIQRSGVGAAGDDLHQEDGDQEDSNEAWSRPFVAGAGDAASTGDVIEAEAGEADAGPDTGDDATPGYINIFAPAGHAAGAGPDSGPEPDEEDAPNNDDPFADRLQRVAMEATGEATGDDPYAATEDAAEEGPVRDIFAEPGDSTGDSTGDNIFADPMAANIGAEPDDGPDNGETQVNFFSAADSAGESAEPDETGETAKDEGGDEFGDEGGEEVETGGSARGEALFGQSDDQPEVEEADEGYTAAGLAQTAGAETVAELMVTAAAWMVLIQGQTTFTRHDVIDVFKGIPGEHSKTLEARIKGFGKAVRNEQLIMVEDGVFGLARTELERFQSLL